MQVVQVECAHGEERKPATLSIHHVSGDAGVEIQVRIQSGEETLQLTLESKAALALAGALETPPQVEPSAESAKPVHDDSMLTDKPPTTDDEVEGQMRKVVLVAARAFGAEEEAAAMWGMDPVHLIRTFSPRTARCAENFCVAYNEWHRAYKDGQPAERVDELRKRRDESVRTLHETAVERARINAKYMTREPKRRWPPPPPLYTPPKKGA